MDWLRENWFWVIVFGGFMWMHMGGHGHGGHGRRGGHRGHGRRGADGTSPEPEGEDNDPDSTSKQDI